jgi:hypothetical protein
MKLYHLSRLKQKGYDLNFEFLVRAKSSRSARKLANANAPGEEDVWLDPPRYPARRLLLKETREF